MDLNRTILSGIVNYDKYARWMEDAQRRETYQEVAQRQCDFHIKHHPQLEAEIREAFEFMQNRIVLGSMRAAQFAGKPAELAPNRLYNCCFAPVKDYRMFSETMFLLLGGSGVGYSVQRHHVAQLPPVRKPVRTRRYLIADSIEGWADAVKVLMKAYLKNGSRPNFDFSDIREKGARLVTSGGKAPGADPLRRCLFNIEQLLNSKENGDQLSPIEVHDIMCFIADAVLAGGIRRSAMISLFSIDDLEMLTCKAGNWWETHPHRGRANNTAVAVRSRFTEPDFLKFWEFCTQNNTGEPGLWMTNDPEMGINPCGEASLKAHQFCNLTEINAAAITTQEELNAAAKAAAFIGTLQASYTGFHYLRPIWERTTKKDALLGVGITGLANESFLALDLTEAANCVLEENARVAEVIGIRPAARTTLVKPSGSTSLLLGTSSGIHAWHSKYYMRRMKLLKTDSLYHYLIKKLPELIEDDWEKPHLQAVLTVPIMAPEGAICREEETPIELLERIKFVQQAWVVPGHRSGANTHCISATVNVREGEWETVGEWMWANRNEFNAISVFPHYGGTHKQLPFESCDEATYLELSKYLTAIDLTEVKEEVDETDLVGEAACAGGACAI